MLLLLMLLLLLLLLELLPLELLLLELLLLDRFFLLLLPGGRAELARAAPRSGNACKPSGAMQVAGFRHVSERASSAMGREVAEAWADERDSRVPLLFIAAALERTHCGEANVGIPRRRIMHRWKTARSGGRRRPGHAQNM